jgi:hypothetical protein
LLHGALPGAAVRTLQRRCLGTRIAGCTVQDFFARKVGLFLASFFVEAVALRMYGRAYLAPRPTPATRTRHSFESSLYSIQDCDMILST